MNVAIEMHDSKCLTVECNELGWGSVLLNAYVHRSDGEAGSARGEGGYQLIRVKIEAMTVEGEVGELPAWIYDGSLAVGESLQDDLIPFPTAHSGSVRLSMTLSDDARVITLSGIAVSIEPEGDFRYLEPFEPSR